MPFVAGNWPPNEVDHHLSSAPKCDWAWEFLRRNAEYQRAAERTRSTMMRIGTIGSDIPVFRLLEHEEGARDWALCSFR